MAEETPEPAPDDASEDSDAEAEMLRMMQEEVGEGEEAAEGGGEEAGGEEGDASQLLEEEMRRAMDEGGDVGGAMTPFEGGGAPAVQQPVEGIDRLSDIDVTVTVELGGNLIPIKDILNWTQGSNVELEPQENDPVDVLVNGKLFAHGEVVVVGDTFGVRILELLDRGEGP